MFARVLQISIDELLGKTKLAPFPPAPLLLITRADVEALDPATRQLVTELMATLRSAIKRPNEDVVARPKKK